MKDEFETDEKIAKEIINNALRMAKAKKEKEFNLKKEREKLFKIYKKRGVSTSLFKLIESQDERFIERLKEKLGAKAIGSTYAEEVIDKLSGKDLI